MIISFLWNMKIIYDISTYFHITALWNSTSQMASFTAKNLASQVCRYVSISIELLRVHYFIAMSRMLNRGVLLIERISFSYTWHNIKHTICWHNYYNISKLFCNMFVSNWHKDAELLWGWASSRGKFLIISSVNMSFMIISFDHKFFKLIKLLLKLLYIIFTHIRSSLWNFNLVT
jgi:hypothetical protein